jgi:hypothetical protein
MYVHFESQLKSGPNRYSIYSSNVGNVKVLRLHAYITLRLLTPQHFFFLSFFFSVNVVIVSSYGVGKFTYFVDSSQNYMHFNNCYDTFRSLYP